MLAQRVRRLPKAEESGLRTLYRYVRSSLPSISRSRFPGFSRGRHFVRDPHVASAKPSWKDRFVSAISKFRNGVFVSPALLSSIAQEIGRRAIRQGLAAGGGASLAFLGLVTVPEVTSPDDELEITCEGIRDSVYQLPELFKVEDNGSAVKDALSLSVLELGPFLKQGSNAAVYLADWKKASRKDAPCIDSHGVPKTLSGKYSLAVKVMFNFTAESHAHSIYEAMKKEILPARSVQLEVDNYILKGVSLPYLPPHPNIVRMFCSFTDRVHLLDQAMVQYPGALPPRLNPKVGFGRNRTLYVVMQRYDSTLRDYLSEMGSKISDKVRLQLTAQLFEALLYLYRKGIAHRDIKSDNILLDLSHVEPLLVLTDFGCALSGPNLRIPFTTESIGRGGNVALMAPEIVCAVPKPSAVLDYSRSDLWAAATIVYEIFGLPNPFYDTLEYAAPDKEQYEVEELPPLPEAPKQLSRMIKQTLNRNPKKRLDQITCATLVELLLYAPPTWFQTMPSSQDIMDWLLDRTFHCVVDKRGPNSPQSLDAIMGKKWVFQYAERADPKKQPKIGNRGQLKPVAHVEEIMKNADILGQMNYRVDGRRPNELRAMSCQIGVNPKAQGSSRFTMGQTEVMCSIYGPHRCVFRREEKASLKVFSRVRMTRFATATRRKGTGGGQWGQSIQRLLEQALAELVLPGKYPKSQISIHFEVMNADGGMDAACLNACSLALMDAGIQMYDYMCAVTVGRSRFLQRNGPIVDMTAREEGLSSGPNMLVVGAARSTNVIGISLKRTGGIHPELIADTIPFCYPAFTEIFRFLKSSINKTSQKRYVSQAEDH
ncbi:unnamed protein product [Cyprideis torosa]|uniref:non-specific serine/threonine protein kinase n=1 Tax=Cyprideis torosa TaxID=163714 RepID=A0A7R8WKX2_9CRUS|nr:unnamed protein product [Cyprideis torosa]CAG0896596.1 unnamed protein product [Cyprideis torosa]